MNDYFAEPYQLGSYDRVSDEPCPPNTDREFPIGFHLPPRSRPVPCYVLATEVNTYDPR